MLWSEELSMPVSVVVAEADAIVHAPSVLRYLKAAPHVHITTFPHAGHADFIAEAPKRKVIVDRIRGHLHTGAVTAAPNA